MSLYDWLLFLHVLAAFSLVATVVLFTYLIAASFGIDRPGDVARTFRMVRVGDVLSWIGAGGTLVFGIWLAIQMDEYQLWDGWIVAALVLWLLVGFAGDRSSKHYSRARDRANALLADGRDEPSAELREILRAPRGLVLHTLVVVLILALLVDMIWKPGG